jgi:uncharacterized membrane protein
VRALLVVHVVLAIFVIGPLVAAANQVARALRARDSGGLAVLSRTVTIYGWGSLLVALFGFGLVRDDVSFSDGWLIGSIVLFVVAAVLVLGLLGPMLRRAAATGGDTAGLAPRAAVIGGIASLCYVLIAILMVWRPS